MTIFLKFCMVGALLVGALIWVTTQMGVFENKGGHEGRPYV